MKGEVERGGRRDSLVSQISGRRGNFRAACLIVMQTVGGLGGLSTYQPRQSRRPWRTHVSLLSAVLFLVLVPWSHQASTLGARALGPLSVDEMATLVSSPDPSRSIDYSNSASHLSKILIPRPREPRSICVLDGAALTGCAAADTENNTFVKDYLVSTMRDLNWHVEEDSFTDNTPYGTKRFTNVIATKDPTAPRRVVVAAHFDSKFFPTYPQNQVRMITSIIFYTMLRNNSF